MSVPDTSPLFELADRILAISRQLHLYEERTPGDRPTVIETTVLRHIDRHPGTTAGAAAEATLLPPSNFSRVLRSLETKGFIRRDTDARDGRAVHLFPTARAEENLHDLDARWSTMLDGILDDTTRDAVVTALTQVEEELLRRRRDEVRRRG